MTGFDADMVHVLARKAGTEQIVPHDNVRTGRGCRMSLSTRNTAVRSGTLEVQRLVCSSNLGES